MCRRKTRWFGECSQTDAQRGPPRDAGIVVLAGIHIASRGCSGMQCLDPYFHREGEGGREGGRGRQRERGKIEVVTGINLR